VFYRFDQDRGDRFDGMRIDNPHPEQRSPDWIYDAAAGISLTVLVEADTAEAATARAEAIGIDFNPENIGMLGLTRTWGMGPTLLYRWMGVNYDSYGFDTVIEALSNSTSYGWFNPWAHTPDFTAGWPVFVHERDAEGWTFYGVEPVIGWRSEYGEQHDLE
jgi:hypothetical protein